MGFLERSLTAKLLAFFLLLAIVPLAVTGYMAYDSGRQSIVTNVRSHLESVAILKEQEIRTWVEHLEHTVTWLAASPQVIDDATVLASYAIDTRQYLAAHDSLVAELDRMAALGHTSPVSLLDGTSGQIIASSDVAWEGKFGDAEPYFIQGKQGTYVSDIVHSLSLGQPTMVVAAPVKDSSGRLVGVLAAHANLEPLSEVMLERSGLGETGETFLVNRSNLLLTNTVFAPDGAFKKWIFDQGAELALAGKSGVGQWVDYRGKPVIGAFRWLEDRKLALIAKQDQAEAFAPIVALRNTVHGISIAVALSATLLAVFFARTITGPVRQLVEGAEEIGRGNLDYRIEVGVRDEIGQLSQAFNQMTENLQAITASRDELNREIAERKRAEEKYGLIIKTALDGFWINDLKGRFLEVNESYCSIIGYTREELLTMSISDIEALEKPEEIAQRMKKVIEQGHDRFETRHRRKDGQILDIEVSINYVPMEEQCFVFIRDITERKQAEEELKQSLAELEASRRAALNMMADADEARRAAELANEDLRREIAERVRVEAELKRSNLELEQFAYVASHDLQEPLRKVQVFGDQLKAKQAQAFDEQGRDYLERMQDAACRMQRMINDLLTFSRIATRAQPFVAVNLRQVAQEALFDLEVQIEQTGGRIVIGDLPTLEADPSQMRQLLENLIGNGLKFHRDGVLPVVEITGERIEGPEGELCQVLVKDNGIGFDEKYLDRLFKPFQRLHGRGEYPGTGIGLAICRRIAERHGGSITAQSAPGQGATFIVTLPVRQKREDVKRDA